MDFMLDEKKQRKKKSLCFALLFSILSKLYQTCGVRGQEKDSMYRPTFYHWISELMM